MLLVLFQDVCYTFPLLELSDLSLSLFQPGTHLGSNHTFTLSLFLGRGSDGHNVSLTLSRHLLSQSVATNNKSPSGSSTLLIVSIQFSDPIETMISLG